jgi:hypothetical protein
MEQIVIFLIVAAAMGVQRLFKKLQGGQEDVEKKRLPPAVNTPPASMELTEADKRYRQVQEEIRRRVAQRQQQTQTATPTPAPQTTYRPSPKSTSPIGRGALGEPNKRPVLTRPVAQPMNTTLAEPSPAMPPMAAMPEASASTTEAAATEAAAYALPEVSAAAGTAGLPPAAGSIRALLATPASIRQAFVLREVLDRPLSLRPAPHGGHDTWL